jgi:hypothetical protein
MPEQSFSKEQSLVVIKRSDILWKSLKRSKPDKNSQYSFDKIVSYIASHEHYQNQYVRVIIEPDAIYFGHDIREIAAAFPELRDMYFGLSNTESLTKKSINERLPACLDARIDFFSGEAIALNEVLAEPSVMPDPLLVPPSMDNPVDQLCILLQQHKAVALGEVHYHKSSKKMLIDNMAALKKAGLETIYLEHVFYDTQQPLLDAYFSSHDNEIPTFLAQYLNTLDSGFFIRKNNHYNYTGLVRAAKEHGIKIIAIDTTSSYDVDGDRLVYGNKEASTQRMKMMNQAALDRYNHHGGKAIFFVGNTHINREYMSVPGLQELLKIPTLIVEDLNDEPRKLASEHPLKPNFLVQMDNYQLADTNAPFDLASSDNNSLFEVSLNSPLFFMSNPRSTLNFFGYAPSISQVLDLNVSTTEVVMALATMMLLSACAVSTLELSFGITCGIAATSTMTVPLMRQLSFRF